MDDRETEVEAYLATDDRMADVLRERLGFEVSAVVDDAAGTETLTYPGNSGVSCRVVLTRVTEPLLRHLGLLTHVVAARSSGTSAALGTLLRAYGGHLRGHDGTWQRVVEVEGLSTCAEISAYFRRPPRLDPPPRLPSRPLRPLRPLGTLPDLSERG